MPSTNKNSTSENEPQTSLKYPILTWILPVLLSPALFFGLKILIEEGDDQQFMGGKYWYIVFTISYIWKGILFSFPTLLINILVYKKLLRNDTSKYVLRSIIGATGIISSFIILSSTLSEFSNILWYYIAILLLSCLLLKIPSHTKD